MSLSAYVIDLLLIALVLRQIRRQTLTPGSIILPTVLIIVAGLNKTTLSSLLGVKLLLIRPHVSTSSRGDVRRPSQPEPASFTGLGVVG